MKNNKRKGFTLTELIIVIVIIGILAAILIPSLSGYIKKAKVSKGEQNARNMTSLLIGEILFNDKEFLMPSDVVEVVKKSGYDLISELPDYSYWYDTETNTIKYLNLEDTINKSISAAGETVGRARVEALSEAHPNWFYIDQTPNALKEAIDAINNLVDNALEKLGSNFKDTDEKTRLEVLLQMDEIVSEKVNNLETLKKLDKVTLSKLSDFIESFNTEDTLYYAAGGYYNRAMQKFYQQNGEIYVERAMFVDGTYLVKEDDYESVKVNLLSPMLIPGTVNLTEATIRTIVSGEVYLSSNATVDVSAFNENVKVSSIANIQNIVYLTKTINPNYDIKEYRFRNGYTVQVDSNSDLEVLISNEGVLLQKTKINNPSSNEVKYRIEPLKTVKWYEKDGSTFHDATYNTKDDKYLTIYDGKEEGKLQYASFSIFDVTEEELESNENVAEYRSNFNNLILSEYLIPTATIDNDTIPGFNFSSLIDDSGKLVGKVEMRSSIEPFSTQYNGVIVDKDMKGYRIDRFGYITDVVINVKQDIFAKAEFNEETKQIDIKYDINDDNKIKIQLDLPLASRKFSNLSNIKVKVYYYQQHIEYKAYPILGSEDIPVAPSIDKIISDEVKEIILEGQLEDGFTGVLENLNDTNFTVSDKTYSVNQIMISKIEILENNTSEAKLLFVRFFR